MVKHIIPTSLKETLTYLQDGSFSLIAGGTDLMIQKRSWAETPPKFNKNMLYILNLEELRYVKKTENNIHIGAMTPLEDLLDHDDCPQLLKEVMIEMAGPGIRKVATLAGNIGNASPAGDSLVPLYVLDASIVLVSLEGERTLPIEEVITGPRQTVIQTNELIKEIVIPIKHYTHHRWIKVGGRRADAISKVSFCATALVDNHVLQSIRIAFGSVYKTIIRNRDIEAKAHHTHLNAFKEDADTFIALYAPLIQPIDDQRSNKVYRKQVAMNMLADFIRHL